MGLRWTTSANRDLVRVHAFLDAADRAAAVRAVQRLITGAKRIARHPRIGVRLAEFEPREVRRLILGDYELRYEVRDDELVILRIWHVHEDR